MHQTLRGIQHMLEVLAQDYQVDELPDAVPAWADPEAFAAADAAITRSLHGEAEADVSGY
jgi:hypothetical protein